MKHVHVWRRGGAFLVSVNRNYNSPGVEGAAGCLHPGKSGLSALWNRTEVKEEEEAVKWELGKGSKRWARGRHSSLLRVLSRIPRGRSVGWYSLNGPVPWVKWSGGLLCFYLLFSRWSLWLQLPTSMKIKRI